MRVHETAASGVLFMGASLIERTGMLVDTLKRSTVGASAVRFRVSREKILTSPNSILIWE